MSSDNLSIQVTKDIEISIRPKNREFEIDIHQSMYAINWFDTKRAWLYKFYNLLAVSSVLKVGGKPYFKANTKELIQGSLELNRSTLLIVRYPNSTSFLKLMGNKFFQLISVFRNGAVKDFTFCFATKTSDQKWQKNDTNLSYILHHYQAEEFESNQLINIVREESPDSAEIHFSGKIAKYLYVKRKNEEASKLTSIIDGLIIYQSSNKELLKQTLLNNRYQSIIDSKLKASSLVELQRIF